MGAIKKRKVYVPVREHPDVNFLGTLKSIKTHSTIFCEENVSAKYIILSSISSVLITETIAPFIS